MSVEVCLATPTTLSHYPPLYIGQYIVCVYFPVMCGVYIKQVYHFQCHSIGALFRVTRVYTQYNGFMVLPQKMKGACAHCYLIEV